jgi:hypothetical protein
MAGTDAVRALRPWSLATFRTTSFMAAAVLTLHLRGILQSTLSRLDTVSGFAFFAIFWVLTWIATRVGLRQAGAEAWSERLPTCAVLMSTTIAGGWNGVFVFAVLMARLLVALAGAQEPRMIAALPVVFLGSVLGSVIAFTIGTIAGFVYGTVDVLVLLVSGALFRWASAERA